MNQQLPAGERWRRNSLAHWPVTDGPVPSSVQLAVDTLVARHAALRSRYGLDEQGHRVQWISPAAEVPVEFHDLGGRPDTQAAGTEIAQQLCQRPFRLDEEFPLRVAAATDGTVVHWLFLVVHHIAVDGLGMAVLRRELQSSLREPAVGQVGQVPERAAAPDQPADEVAYERTDRARRASEGSLKYWREIATKTPSTTLPVPPPDDRAPDYGEWSSTSAQAAVAGQAVARRHGVHEPVVLLALFTLLLWGYTGSDRQVIDVIASNRYAPARMRVVTSVTQPLYVLFAELGPDLRLSELLRRAREATMQVYRLGRYDEDAVAELLARQAFERGANLASVPIFNPPPGCSTTQSSLPVSVRAMSS